MLRRLSLELHVTGLTSGIQYWFQVSAIGAPAPAPGATPPPNARPERGTKSQGRALARPFLPQETGFAAPRIGNPPKCSRPAPPERLVVSLADSGRWSRSVWSAWSWLPLWPAPGVRQRQQLHALSRKAGWPALRPLHPPPCPAKPGGFLHSRLVINEPTVAHSGQMRPIISRLRIRGPEISRAGINKLAAA